MQRRIAVQRDLLWRAVTLNCSREKALCGCDISMPAQKKVKCVAKLIDGSV